MASKVSIDNEKRRLGFERRYFFYAGYIPERRSDKDRRKGLERRLEPRTTE